MAPVFTSNGAGRSRKLERELHAEVAYVWTNFHNLGHYSAEKTSSFSHSEKVPLLQKVDNKKGFARPRAIVTRLL